MEIVPSGSIQQLKYTYLTFNEENFTPCFLLCCDQLLIVMSPNGS